MSLSSLCLLHPLGIETRFAQSQTVCACPLKAMWLYLVALVGLWTLLRLIRERQVVSHLQDKHVFITGCDSGFGNLLARQLDRRGMRVLAACLTEKGAEELRNKTSDRLETVILDVTKTESIVAATQWVKERVGNRGTTEIHVCVCCFDSPLEGVSWSHSLARCLMWVGALQVPEPPALP